MKKSILLLLTALVLFFASCTDSRTTRESFFAMDTIIDIIVLGEADKNVIDNCEVIIKDIEAMLSKTVETSDIARINSSDAVCTVSPETADIINQSVELFDFTEGAFDIFIKPLVDVWSIGAEGFEPPDEDSIAAAMGLSGREHFDVIGVTVTKDSKGCAIDLGGIGKGYALEKTVNYLSSSGYSGCVSFGGNIGAFGKKANSEPWNIAIKNPFEPSEIIGTVKIPDGYVSVSGGYERYSVYGNKRYHHIIDPATGCPSESDLASAAVISGSGILSDALSTAAFILGSERTMELYQSGKYDFEAVLIKNDGEIILTDKLESDGAFTPIQK